MIERMIGDESKLKGVKSEEVSSGGGRCVQSSGRIEKGRTGWVGGTGESRMQAMKEGQRQVSNVVDRSIAGTHAQCMPIRVAVDNPGLHGRHGREARPSSNVRRRRGRGVIVPRRGGRRQLVCHPTGWCAMLRLPEEHSCAKKDRRWSGREVCCDLRLICLSAMVVSGQGMHGQLR